MPRQAIEINRNELQDAIEKVEADNGGPFANRTLLWQAVEATEWAKSRKPRPLTAPVAYLKCNEFGLHPSTPIGKKGKQKGSGPVVKKETTGKTKAKVRGDKESLEKEFGKKHSKAVAKLLSGSMKAAIKLKCIDCCCGQKKEVARCPIKGCPLWGFRPYKSTKEIDK